MLKKIGFLFSTRNNYVCTRHGAHPTSYLQGTLTHEVKRMKSESDHLHLHSTKLKMTGSSNPRYLYGVSVRQLDYFIILVNFKSQNAVPAMFRYYWPLAVKTESTPRLLLLKLWEILHLLICSFLLCLS